jgi:GDP-D-mannose dehydratase
MGAKVALITGITGQREAERESLMKKHGYRVFNQHE